MFGDTDAINDPAAGLKVKSGVVIYSTIDESSLVFNKI